MISLGKARQAKTVTKTKTKKLCECAPFITSVANTSAANFVSVPVTPNKDKVTNTGRLMQSQSDNHSIQSHSHSHSLIVSQEVVLTSTAGVSSLSTPHPMQPASHSPASHLNTRLNSSYSPLASHQNPMMANAQKNGKKSLSISLTHLNEKLAKSKERRSENQTTIPDFFAMNGFRHDDFPLVPSSSTPSSSSLNSVTRNQEIELDPMEDMPNPETIPVPSDSPTQSPLRSSSSSVTFFPLASGTPPAAPTRQPPITLVLDLDETLVHCSTDFIPDSDFTFIVTYANTDYTVYAKKRPNLEVFLNTASSLFNLVVFTASQQIYADALLDILDPDNIWFKRRLFRDSCVYSDGNFLKDLSTIEPDLSRIFIIDNSPQAYSLQTANGLPIPSWFDDRCDTALYRLLPFLCRAAACSDVRTALKELPPLS
eukprot:TRINITY_DN95_c6_g1_i1.p1 TRINITY_DN95_c6_g1~~TRINITY_DN95_c6_g1_i1.p1  ORF type:complete len:427 (-),score=103.10 TRINITY_DN95_c6_g1_i1:278-1558(-)